VRAMQFMSEIAIGDDIVLCAERAAILKGLNACVIADLHIGVESGFIGTALAFQNDEMLGRIERVFSRYHINKVVIDGDLKHTFSGNVVEEWRYIPEFIGYLQDRADLYIVRGNHDNFLVNIADKYGIALYDELKLGRFIFAHGHKPLPERKDNEIFVLGHEHPAVKLRDRVGGYVKMAVFVWHPGRFLILPAFSPWTYGHELLDGDVAIQSMTYDDYLNARIFGCTEYGIIDLATLKDLENVQGV